MYNLIKIDDKLCLTLDDNPKFKPVCVDFNNPALNYRLKQGGKENLIKACGLKKIKNTSVIDATAGFGTDSFIMASYGATIIMLERQDFMYKLLQDGLNRATQLEKLANIINNMQLVNISAIDYLNNIVADNFPDIVYIDPMFPEKTNTAASKKEMTILQSLIGKDADEKDLFTAAMKVAKKRVVVKRPKNAPIIGNSQPDLVITGKSGRFDVYIIKS